MATTLRIDFVSDVSCPWCIIGLRALQQAIALEPETIAVDLHFQPFELNPDMPAHGQDITEHIAEKYGASADQIAQNRAAIRQRGESLGFTFNLRERDRIYNTFDAHRLLHWADLEGHQIALKEALFDAYFTRGLNPSSHTVLIELARQVGLDPDEATRILASDAFADDVREREQFYLQQGIHSVPAVIINERHLISGGQPVEVFANALRQISSMG